MTAIICLHIGGEVVKGDNINDNCKILAACKQFHLLSKQQIIAH